MGREMKARSFAYLPAVDDPELFQERLGRAAPGGVLVVGEYGALSPLTAINELKAFWKNEIYLELTAAGKNRDLIRSSLISAARSGFAGVLIASGKFTRAPGMGKPVFDLDPSQMLKLARGMKDADDLPENFTLALRAPEGGEAALARTRFFLENGADLVVYKNSPPEEVKNRSSIIREI